MEWDGADCPIPHRIVFYTEEFVDLEEEIVLGGLLSSIQRSGIVDSISDARRAIDHTTIYKGYFGIIDGEEELNVCDHEGWTSRGEMVEVVRVATWVGLYV
jgi:hypothetical protein